MKNKVIEIRSNITESVIKFEVAEAERKEREEKERKERWEKESKEREEKAAKWKAGHPNMEKYTYCSAYNFETFNYEYGGQCKLYFYEWSDICREPLVFNYYPYLYRFLDECGILLSADDNTKLRSCNTMFVVCKPNSKDLIVARSYNELSEQYEETKKLNEILATVPDV